MAAFYVGSDGSISSNYGPCAHHDLNTGVEILIANTSLAGATGLPLLDVQVVVDAQSAEVAATEADEILREYLDCLSLITSLSFKIEGLRAVIDWTPGLPERACVVYQQFPAAEMPHDVLAPDLIDAAALLSGVEKPPIIARALRWFAIAVRSPYSDEQFQFFWLVLELVAQYVKGNEKVSDSCPRCRGPLYCPVCSAIPTHRPYPKQAIRQLVSAIYRPNPDDFFEACNDIRNALAHGEDLDAFLTSRNLELSKVVDDLGNVARIALLDASKPLVNGLAESLPVLETNVYSPIALTSKVELIITSADPDRPSVSDIPTFQQSVTFSKQGKPDRETSGRPFARPQ